MNAVAKIAPVERATDGTPAPTGLALLRAPFPEHQISQLPKESRAQREAREKDRSLGVNCKICNGWHHKNVVHLPYVGHAALTDRLLDSDPTWSWEPMAYRDGLPAFDPTGGLWIKLTVCGVTRLGYGHAAPKTHGGAADPGNREKEVIGDALRNAAMRFGAALDLWHKGDLHGAEDDQQSAPTTSAADMAINLLRGCGSADLFKEAWAKNKDGWKQMLDPADAARVWAVKDEVVGKFKAEAERERPVADTESTPFDDEIPF